MDDLLEGDYDFLNQTVEFLIDQLHQEVEYGNIANATALAYRIREIQEV